MTSTTNHHPKYMTIREVADFVNVSEATVRNWLKRGLLRAATIGAVIRIRLNDLELLLNRNSIVNTNAAERTRRGRYERANS